MSLRKRSPARQAYAEPHTLPDMEMGDNMTDAGLDMETEAYDMETITEEETEGGGGAAPKRVKRPFLKKKKMKILSPTETVGSGAFSKIQMQTTGDKLLSTSTSRFARRNAPIAIFTSIPESPAATHQILREAFALEWDSKSPSFEAKIVTRSTLAAEPLLSLTEHRPISRTDSLCPRL